LHTHRQARILALQALYELDTTQHMAADVIAYRLEDQPLPPEGEAFLRSLVGGVLTYLDRLDELIQRYAPAWPVAQIAVVDRNVLRIALFELSGQTETPPKVAINEAVDLAKLFGSDSSFRFVNGVLGSAMAENEHVTLSPAAATPTALKD
jgi:transcription antitermination protein NusB